MIARKKWIFGALLLVSLTFFSRIVYSEEGKNFKPKFSIKLTGGLGYVKFGDINLSLGSVNNNEVFEYWRKNDPERVDGKIKKLNSWINDWEIELRIDITPEIAVGIATSGAIHRKNESSLTYTYKGSAGDQISAFTYRPEFEASMPVKLNLYYSVAYGPKSRIVFNGGIAHYSAKASQYRKFELTPPDSFSEWVKRYWDINRKSFFGFHLGVGWEYSLTKNIALIIEGQGRYARSKGFKGNMQLEHIFEGIYHEEKGTLYYIDFWDPAIGALYTDLEVWEKPPEIILFKGIIREAFLDLGGLSLRVGIRIKLL